MSSAAMEVVVCLIVISLAGKRVEK